MLDWRFQAGGFMGGGVTLVVHSILQSEYPGIIGGIMFILGFVVFTLASVREAKQ